MSIDKKRVAIFSNLPSGGARVLYGRNLAYLSSKVAFKVFIEKVSKPKNIVHYLYICLIYLPFYYYKISNNIVKKFDVILAYHSWLTKSPYILRYSKLPKIYICHEPMREYSDSLHKKGQSLKERIINFIRLPIKYMDKINLKSKKLTVIANSNFSKEMIDNYYGITSTVIYPGIDIKLYKPSKKTTKLNQVISVGSINKLKGFDFLVRVISRIDINLRPSLVLVGNGVDINYLNMIRDLALKLSVNLIIKLNISSKELIAEYHKSKAFVYAPINEPFGVVVEEAMACGLSILGYEKGGGYVEILDDKTGFTISSRNPDEWANKLLKMMSNEINSYNIDYIKKNFSEAIMNKNILQLINKL